MPRQVADHLCPVRLAAQMQLQLHDACRATYCLFPRQPREQVEAE